MAKEATQDEYERIWEWASELAEKTELIEGSWVKPSLTIELFRVGCRQKGYTLPAGLVRS